MKQAIRLMEVNAFGWRVIKMRLPEGKSYGVIVGHDSERKVIGSAALVVAGCIESRNLSTGEVNTRRKPGSFSPELGPIPAGRYQLTALEDADWWCADSRQNGRDVPVEALHLSEGASVEGLVLVCSGRNEGATFKGYTAPESCYVMRFAEARP